MRFSSRTALPALAVALALARPALGGPVTASEEARGDGTVHSLSNGVVRYGLVLEKGRLVSDFLASEAGGAILETDAGFGLDLTWTGWRAPGKKNNADNPVLLGKDDFTVEKVDVREAEGGAREIVVSLKGKESEEIFLAATLSIRMAPDDFFVRKRLTVSDPKGRGHFLRSLSPVRAGVLSAVSTVKAGDFGQPVALRTGAGGAFLGLEYPAADNRLEERDGKASVRCGQEVGERIGKDELASDWAVVAVTPDPHVKSWFLRYVAGIRVAPARPYTLYNSWYDLRAPEIAKGPETVMNEENTLRIVGLLRKNMIEKGGVPLDAFVLDDGWDVYRSDWVLREKEWPRGLSPVSAALKETGTTLGLWFGPTGGYSKRAWRLEWMKEHGYETVGDQLCVAGTNYGSLLVKRTADLVEKQGAGYFKWDGIQFSCSEPDHGHPVDVYSRRAALAAVGAMARAVREKRPDTFLNITSGTWLSPWWLKVANQIWMDGEDYAYADVPSISRRDSAITYRDFVLYEDFKLKDLWFPIANLMTHGIIKGHLERLGSETEPLSKFTDDALLYVARGISMYELYISPDILSAGEWKAISESIGWAKDRFDVLKTTAMVGGDPKARETYGYVHFSGRRGIVAARNPWIAPSRLTVELSPAEGLDPAARDLVLERVYPTRWVSPRLLAAGQSADLPLDGYETAVYEIYPLAEAEGPLPAGVEFDVVKSRAGRTLRLFGARGEITWHGPSPPRAPATRPAAALPEPVANASVRASGAGAEASFTVHASVRAATLAILQKPDRATPGRDLPSLTVTVDGRAVKPSVERQKGLWAWHSVDVSAGAHAVKAVLEDPAAPFTGTLSVFAVTRQAQPVDEVAWETRAGARERPMPPRPYPAGERQRHVLVGEAALSR